MTSPETILVIEDDPTLLRGLKDNFASRSYGVRTASDGEHGLEVALTHKPDLIVLDLMLPTLNGFEICRRIREAELDMPIIMLTSKGQEEDIVRGLNLGADDYMTKPFSIRELLARVQAFLRRRRSGQAELYRFGELRLDLGSHRLLKNGAAVPLSPKEFRLLELFVRRAGRALTREEIMRTVWGREVLVTARSVDRCVTTLRGKIEPDSRHPTYIHTIRDVGYRFEIGEELEAERSPAAVSAALLAPGTHLGHFEILALLGRGGMGEVYHARDTRLEREVALKVLAPHLVEDAEALARFKREAKILATLSHPNVLALFDAGAQGGRAYAVTELLRGETLRDRISRSRLEWATALEIGLAVARAMAVAHGRGIVHRDLKPSNIFLTDEGGVKVLDFGLAQAAPPAPAEASVEDPTLTLLARPGGVVGTAGYMAPEQVRGLAADARSDIFSLGCVLYEMLAGRGPFARATPADTLAATLKDSVPEPPQELPREFARIVLHCLERDPARRFQSAGDLAFALDGVPSA